MMHQALFSHVVNRNVNIISDKHELLKPPHLHLRHLKIDWAYDAVETAFSL